MSAMIERAAATIPDMRGLLDGGDKIDVAQAAVIAALSADDEALVQHVARGLYACENRSLDGWTFDKECTNPDLRAYWLRSARAAVEAMKAFAEGHGQDESSGRKLTE